MTLHWNGFSSRRYLNSWNLFRFVLVQAMPLLFGGSALPGQSIVTGPIIGTVLCQHLTIIVGAVVLDRFPAYTNGIADAC